MNILKGFTLLLLFQLAGETVVMLLALPVPGPVVGMGCLLLYLVLRKRDDEGLLNASSVLLKHLSLLFVPAGVGVVVHLARIEHEWLAIGVALVASTLVTLVATAGTMALLMRLRGQGNWRRDGS